MCMCCYCHSDVDVKKCLHCTATYCPKCLEMHEKHVRNGSERRVETVMEFDWIKLPDVGWTQVLEATQMNDVVSLRVHQQTLEYHRGEKVRTRIGTTVPHLWKT